MSSCNHILKPGQAIKGNVSVSVDAGYGYKIRATKDGVLSKPEKIDLKKIKRWWKHKH